jgi:hypothetical protein
VIEEQPELEICLFSPCGIHPDGFFLKEKIKMRGK